MSRTANLIGLEQQPIPSERLELAMRLRQGRVDAAYLTRLLAEQPTDSLIQREIIKIKYALLHGKAPETPNLRLPEMQLLWAAALCFVLNNPGVMRNWAETGGKPLMLHETPLWQQLQESPKAKRELVENAFATFEAVRDDEFTMRWGKPGSWFWCDPEGKVVNMDFLYTLIAGFEHTRSVTMHELGHAVLTKKRWPKWLELQEEFKALMEKAKVARKNKKDLTRDEYKQLNLLQIELNMRHQLWNACEDNCVNRYAVNMSDAIGQEFGVSLNHISYTLTGVGIVAKQNAIGEESKKPKKTDAIDRAQKRAEEIKALQDKINNVGHAANMSFFCNNGLFADTPAGWKQSGADIAAIGPWSKTAPAGATKAEIDAIKADKKSFDYLRKLCGSLQGLEHTQPKGRDRLYGRQFWDKRVLSTNDTRNEIIDEIWNIHAEPHWQELKKLLDEEIEEQLKEAEKKQQQKKDANKDKNKGDKDKGDKQEGDKEDGDKDGDQEGNDSKDGDKKDKGKKGKKDKNGEPDPNGEKSDEPGDDEAGDEQDGDKEGNKKDGDKEGGDKPDDKAGQKGPKGPKGYEDEGQGKGDGQGQGQGQGQGGGGGGGEGGDEDDVPVEGAGDMPGPGENEGEEADGEGAEGEGQGKGQKVKDLMGKGKKGEGEESESDSEGKGEESDAVSRGGGSAGSGGRGFTKEELSQGTLENYQELVRLLTGPINQVAQQLRRIQEHQLQTKRTVGKSLTVLPEDGEIDRLNPGAHRDLIIKQKTGQTLEESDFKRFRTDRDKQIPTEIDIAILIDGSGSMSSKRQTMTNMELAMRTAIILYEAARQVKGVNVYIGMFGPKDPPILAVPGTDIATTGKNLDAARKGMGSGTDLAPGIVKMVQTLADAREPTDKLVGYTHLMIITDGDIFDEAESRQKLETLYDHTDKITVDVAIIDPRTNTGMDNLANNTKANRKAQKVGLVHEIDEKKVADSIIGVLFHKMRIAGSFVAQPKGRKRQEFKRAVGAMKRPQPK